MLDQCINDKGLAKLREPFPEHQISKLPKPTKAQNECVANEKRECKICGGWHHPRVMHLDYVGHAALTDRLLDADLRWNWEPIAFNDQGLPEFDATGGLWIRLTVCGVTRLGYGHAVASSYKEIGAREKEVIGDALRNAAMRFGAALDLWHKGDLHLKDDIIEQGNAEVDAEVKIDPAVAMINADIQPRAGVEQDLGYEQTQQVHLSAKLIATAVSKGLVREALETFMSLPNADEKVAVNKLLDKTVKKIVRKEYDDFCREQIATNVPMAPSLGAEPDIHDVRLLLLNMDVDMAEDVARSIDDPVLRLAAMEEVEKAKRKQAVEISR